MSTPRRRSAPSSLSRRWLTSATCVLGLFAVLQTRAANTWDGGAADGNWSSAANWDDDTVPVSPAALTFGGSVRLASTNDLAGFTLSSLAFARGAGAFTVDGVAATLGGGIENNSPNLQTLSLPLSLSAGRTVNAAFGDIAITGAVSSTGNFDLSKTGPKTLTLSGAHTYAGRTGIGNFPNGVGMTPSTHQGGGTLVLDFSAPASPVSNILYNGVSLTATQELRLSGGALVIKGRDATANTQSVGALGLATGFNRVSLQPGADGKVLLNVASIGLAAGAANENNKSSLVNFELPAGAQDSTNGIVTNSLNHANGILTPVSGNIANLVVDKTSWATNATNAAGGNIVGLPDLSYTASTETTAGTSTQNVDVVTDVSVSNPTVWTLRFNNTGSTGPRTFTNTNAGAAMTVGGGGILVTPAMGADDVTITGGGLRGSSNRGLFISNYNTGGGQLIIGSNITNNGNTNALVVGGGGVVRLNGNSTYTAGTYVLKDTTLVVSSDANLGGSIGNVTVTSASSASPTVTLSSNSTLNSGALVVGSSFLGSTVSAVNIGASTVTLAGNANADIAAATTVSYATAPAISLDGGVLRADGTTTLQRAIAADASGVGGAAASDRRIGLSAHGGTIEVTEGNTLTVTGVVSSQTTSGFGALVKSGSGTLVLSGANTYAGGTTINAGTLVAGSNTALGASPASLTFAPSSGGVFRLGGKSVTLGALSADADAVIENSAATNGTLVVNTSGAIGFPGTLRDGSSHLLQLTKQGSGSLTLSGANTHGGDTLLSTGTIVLAHSLALQSSTLNQQVGASSGIVFDASVASRAFTFGGLKNNGAPTIALENNATSPEAVTLSLGANNQSTTYGGVFTGAGSLVKVGTGKLTLTGANTYSGTTSVAAGTLALSGEAALGAGELTLAAGSTFDLSALTAPTFTLASLNGAGTVEASGKALQVSAALVPVGAIQVNGDLSLGAASASSYSVSASSHDTLAVSGTLTLDGQLSVVAGSGFSFADGQSHDFYEAGSTVAGLDGVVVNGLALTNNSGVWSGAASGLSYTFTESTGVLAVASTSSATALETWRQTHFGTTANSGPGADGADFDGDGLANLLEYATGTNPTQANASVVAVGRSGSKLTMTYTRIADASLVYTVEGRSDLATGAWTTVAAANNPATGSAADQVTVTDSETLGTGTPRRFLRLKVSY